MKNTKEDKTYEKLYGLYLLAAVLFCACSAPTNNLQKNPNTPLGYLDKSGKIELDLSKNSGPFIDVAYRNLSNEEIAAESKYIVYAEVSDVNYYNDKQLYSIVKVNVLDSFGSETAPQTLYLGSDQCILPAREAIADPEEYAKTLEEYEKDPESTWLPDEDEYSIQILPGERFYNIGDRYILLLRENQLTSSETNEPLMSVVQGLYGAFLEVGENQFVNIREVHSDLQTMTLDSSLMTDPEINDTAAILSHEDFRRLGESDEFPVAIYTPVVTKVEDD